MKVVNKRRALGEGVLYVSGGVAVNSGRGNSQMDQDCPGNDDGKSPFRTLDFSAHVLYWTRVVSVYRELHILEIWRVVHHEQDQDDRE